MDRGEKKKNNNGEKTNGSFFRGGILMETNEVGAKCYACPSAPIAALISINSTQ